jgi:branched-chain amino acid transport system ATP-binding protein
MIDLELKGVIKSFDGIKAVDGVSIGFERGKITALVGPNGAGKTTLFNLINGFTFPDAGEIRYKNRNIVGLPPWDVSNLGIGRLFQDVRVFEKMTAQDNVLCAFKGRRGDTFFWPILGRWIVRKEERCLEKNALKLLEFVGIADKSHEFAESLSYGQQKLLSLARLLAADSDVLLLDEPTAGISPDMVRKILDLIRALATKGKTAVVIEHNMNIVSEVADWVYFMDDGQVVSFGLPQDVLGDPEVRKKYIGI